MALENARKFLEQVMKDKALRARTAEKKPVEVVAVARELGFDVTEEELGEAVKAMRRAEEPQELSLDELDEVSAGGPGCDVEKIRDKDTEEEGGNGHAQLLESRSDPVHAPAGLLRGPKTQRQRAEHNDHEADHDHQERHLKLGHDQIGHRLPVAVGNAEISGKETGKPAEILDDKGLVQTHFMPQTLQHFGCGVRSKNCLGGIAGDHMEGGKCQEGYHDHGNDKRQDAAHCIFQNAAPFFGV